MKKLKMQMKDLIFFQKQGQIFCRQNRETWKNCFKPLLGISYYMSSSGNTSHGHFKSKESGSKMYIRHILQQKREKKTKKHFFLPLSSTLKQNFQTLVMDDVGGKYLSGRTFFQRSCFSVIQGLFMDCQSDYFHTGQIY